MARGNVLKAFWRPLALIVVPSMFLVGLEVVSALSISPDEARIATPGRYFVLKRYVVLKVSDAGAGTSDEVRARAFDPCLTTKALGGGTGLGLSQVYGFAKQSRGHVELRAPAGNDGEHILAGEHCGRGEHASGRPAAGPARMLAAAARRSD